MQTSIAHTSEIPAASLAQLPWYDPCLFKFTDPVVLTLHTSDALGTLTSPAATDNAGAAGQPIGFQGWCLTIRGLPGETDALGAAGAPKTQAPLVKFAADLTVQMTNSSEAAGRGLSSEGAHDNRQRLLQLQRSYQAAAQFLQVAQTQLDTLVQTVWVDNQDQP